jgi:predicted DNA repair protein MutK
MVECQCCGLRNLFDELAALDDEAKKVKPKAAVLDDVAAKSKKKTKPKVNNPP